MTTKLPDAWTPEMREKFVTEMRFKAREMAHDPEYHLDEFIELLKLNYETDKVWQVTKEDIAAIMLLGACLTEIQ